MRRIDFWVRRGAAMMVVLLLVLGLAACGGPSESQERPAPPPPPVTVLTVQTRDVEVVREYPARVHGSRQVQVRSRVEGILRERLFEEGRSVNKDELLFRIDPERYEIALLRAEADLADARASLNHAQREWARYSNLFAEAAVSELEKDKALTDLERAQARHAQAEVVVADARRSLGYTEVRAPVAGVTGMESLSEGNLIEWAGLLATITQQDPVHVRFAMPEVDAAMRGVDERSRRAKLLLPGGLEHPRQGDIDFTASVIDPRTGTVTARAVFPNPDLTLIPGQFVRIQVVLRLLEEVFTVPEAAVGQGRETTHLFVVDDENTARLRPVRLGPVTDGRQIILEGLKSGDQVVINGQAALRDGMPVNVVETVHDDAMEDAPKGDHVSDQVSNDQIPRENPKLEEN
ncbi:efflux RND transporter periplasmic adaptor subunit [Desulfonatronum sp. SC1]|uniref:efflux RND transporter periplasmic adaptor subunit n=1 Tax=Desulfonatronum sp. SC1 TaxID=2109626 RepID=UPI0018EE4EDC|nr:efflux RND transporter periplasmic adaptor subunit [Desulfonatronum sp. SC1]